MPISILHDFTKSILQKYALHKNFVFYFSHDKALCADVSLLATHTVMTGMVRVNNVVWEMHLSHTSESILKKTEGELSVIYIAKQRDDDSDDNNIASALLITEIRTERDFLS